MWRKLVTAVAAGSLLGGTAIVGTAMGAGEAAAARPTVRVCATLATTNKPYVGPVTLIKVNRDWLDFGKSLRTLPNGCITFTKGVTPNRKYRATIYQTIQHCNTMTGPDGETQKWGTNISLQGTSKVHRTPKSGQIEIGPILVYPVSSSC